MSDSSDDLRGEDSDSDQDLFDEDQRRRQRDRARESAIYGVFYDDDDKPDSYQRDRRRGRNETGVLNIAPQFVKGQSAKVESDDEIDKTEDDDDDMFNDGPKVVEKDANDMDIEEEEEQMAEEKAKEEELKRQQESANEYFFSLLKRGKRQEYRKSAASTKRPQITPTEAANKTVAGSTEASSFRRSWIPQRWWTWLHWR
jgi:hypothetical protein